MEGYVLQNNIIDIYQNYFDDLIVTPMAKDYGIRYNYKACTKYRVATERLSDVKQKEMKLRINETESTFFSKIVEIQTHVFFKYFTISFGNIINEFSVFQWPPYIVKKEYICGNYTFE